jgi:diguanylate cyclase (GGDEF)-like protein
MKYSSPPGSSAADDHAPANPQEVIGELQSEKLGLQQQLQEVTQIAAANEAIWRHFLDIERILFRTRRLDQLVQELLREIKNRFQMDWVVLYVIHPDLLERFFPDLPQEGQTFANGTWVLPVHGEELQSIFQELSRPLTFQPQDQETVQWLPAETQGKLQSGVWIPLTFHEMVFGTLLVGSQDAGRYHPQHSTDLLEQLGINIALCMDNCLIYEKMKELTRLDPLTGLINLFQLQGMLEMEFRKAYRNKSPLSLLLVELDWFQRMNANFGQETAVAVLKHAAALLQRVCREGDVLGRYGSGEFLVLLPDADDDDAAYFAAEFQQVLRKTPFTTQNTAILMQASIGWASLHEGMERAQDLLAAASTELYRAKLARPQRSFREPA